ncbi:hypothetical protein CJ030_MR7G001983 [Morella rubra]|uniref:NAC domain-containing protein n=1 Tax=Morella rubra TaxID=262757 RepID=A0A6A1WU29_9ROSI|nr:hypothetical protein CJ030_MR7G001983 [Morella rubra]
MSGSSLIGMKRTLVFYEGRARKCTKTSWVTHEYRTEPYQNSFLLCRVFDKRKGPNGAGPSVQSPTTSKSHLDETNSEIALGSVSPSSEVKVPDFGTRTINDGFHAENSDAAISDATTAVENQSAQDTFAEDEQLRPSEEDFEFLAACMQEPVDATELKEGMNREKVSPAFPEVSPVTDGGVVLKNGMNENAAYSLEDFISLDDLDDNFGNESGGQKNLASGFETPMNIVFSEDNGSFSGSNAEHGRVPWQYWANNPAAYFPECWESVFYNQDNISPQ